MITNISVQNLKTKLPIFNLLAYNVWMAGGVVRDCIIGEKYSDVDIFGSETNLDRFKAAELKDFKLVHESDLLETYQKDDLKVQLIYRDFESPEECIQSFDYTICMFAYDGVRIICEADAILHLFNKKLVVNKLSPEYVVSSLERMQKYIKKGYTICAGGIQELVSGIRFANQEQINSQFKYYPNGDVRIIYFD